MNNDSEDQMFFQVCFGTTVSPVLNISTYMYYILDMD